MDYSTRCLTTFFVSISALLAVFQQSFAKPLCASCDAVEGSTWEYGYFSKKHASSAFRAFQHEFTYYGPIGGDKRVLGPVDESYPRIGQYAMSPSSDEVAVKRWKSDRDGLFTLVVDSQKLGLGGDGVEVVVRNGSEKIYSKKLTDEASHRTNRFQVNLRKGQWISLETWPHGSHHGDWASVRLKILDTTYQLPAKAQFFSFDQENDCPQGWCSEPSLAPGLRVPDEGGWLSGRHATRRELSVADESFWKGVIGNALSIDGYRSRLEFDAPSFKQPVDELTIAFWMAPSSFSELSRPTILASAVEGSDIAAVSISPKKRGGVLEFRIQPEGFDRKAVKGKGPLFVAPFVLAPEFSTKYARWQHVMCVWRSGKRQEIWINGQLVTAHRNPVEGPISLTGWQLGNDRRPGIDRRFEGLLDELMIVPSAISHEEARAYYREQRRLAHGGVRAALVGGLTRERWTKSPTQRLEDFKFTDTFFEPARRVALFATSHTDEYRGHGLAERIRGKIRIEESGYYRFWVAATGEVELLLSADSLPFRKRVIASVSRELGAEKGVAARTSNPFDFFDSQASEPIWLEGGSKYFIEALQVNGRIHNNRIALAWETPSKPRELIPALELSPHPGVGHLKEDRDDDSLPDEWEATHGLNPEDNGETGRYVEGEYGDFDDDGLINRLEYILGTNPAKADTDGDGFTDGQEYHSFGSNPLTKDKAEGELVHDLDISKVVDSEYETDYNQGTLYTGNFRGTTSWDFTVPETDAYFIDIKVKLGGLRVAQAEVPLSASVDGRTLANESVRFSGSHTRVWRVYSPVLKKGSHRLGLFSDNDRILRDLQIVGVAIHRPTGIDADNDGIPDWYEKVLYQGSDLLVSPPTSFTSPYFVEGTSRQGWDQVRIDGKGVQSLGREQWFANLPLREDSNHFVVQMPDGRSFDLRPEWQVLSPFLTKSIKVRVGDSLRFGGITSTGDPAKVRLRSDEGLNVLLKEGETHVQTFKEAGTFWFRVRIPGTDFREVCKVEVVGYQMRERLTILSYFQRHFELAETGRNVALWTSKELLLQRLQRRNGLEATHRILSTVGGNFTLAARLGEGGAVISTMKVPSMVFTSALQQNTFGGGLAGAPRGFEKITAPYVGLHMPEGSYVRIGLFRAGMMFPDGSNEKILKPEDFVDGVAFVDFLMPREMQGGFCHHISIYSPDGTLLNKN